MIGISVVSVIILLGVLIFAHELGHFLAAKYAGVQVLKFSLGFGRKLFGKKIGDTEYLVSLVPLGGYVKLLGESERELLPDGNDKHSFMKQSVWKRIGIVLAGPVFNFVLAIMIFWAVYMIGLPALKTAIGEVQEGSAAYESGIRANDTIVAIDGRPVPKWEKLSEMISDSGGKTLKITISRDGQVIDLSVTPKIMKGKNIFGEEVDAYKIGVSPTSQTFIERMNPFDALWTSLKKTWFISKLTLVSLVKIFEGVVSPKTLGGPILIAQIAGAQAKEGFIPFFLFMALLSINLGVLNLLPIPILDGGHLLFNLIEIIIRKPVSLKWREKAQQIGFVILVMLMIFVFMVDIDRLDIKIINDFTRIFTGK